MTTATFVEVSRRSHRGARVTAAGFAAGVFLAAATALGCDDAAAAKAWPSDRYRAAPVAYAREVLGVEPWSKQVEILEAVRDHKRVAVAAGHKVSKSHSAAIIAAWFYCSFDDARVVMSSTTSRQVDQILWREFRMLVARGGRCVQCKRLDARGPKPCAHSALIDGDMHELARSGLKANDFREVVGFTAREAEAVAGVSGKNLLYIIDEASGVPDAIFEAIEGNRAGGARLVMFSNPTRTEGEFYEAFDTKAEFYRTIEISSEDSPNVVEGLEVIPGLATREWVEEKKREWGVDSALYKIRVQGKFVLKEDGKVLSVHAISEAESRWVDTKADGRLFIGLDPAGPGLGGDESAFAARRGPKVLDLLTHRGLTEEAHLAHLLGLISQHKQPRDLPPIVNIDREGPIGSRVFGILKAHADQYREDRKPFEVVGVRSSDRAHREPKTYDRVRDELWANLARWIREGGAIVEDTKLAKELHSPEWVPQLSGRLKVTPKDEMRKALGRSPDRADAVALSVWDPTASGDEAADESAAEPLPRATRAATRADLDDEGVDPHTGIISPYGGGLS